MQHWQPTAPVDAMTARAALLARIRAFFSARDITEVETPVLSPAGNSDPGIEQFSLDSSPHRWLRTSPEYAMKRLLAAASGDIYELSRVFRQGESGRHHNPEFTLLEWYRVGWTYHELMKETAELVNACGEGFDRHWRPVKISYREWFKDHAGIDPLAASCGRLSDCARAHRLEVENSEQMDRDEWLHLIVSHVIQPALECKRMYLVYDFPATQAALARIRPGEPPAAERFEIFLGPTELANGYQELTDPNEQRARFEAENARRQRAGQATPTLDENLLSALEHGLPDCAGVALGVDRLLMACLGAESLDQVIAFPFDRA